MILNLDLDKQKLLGSAFTVQKDCPDILDDLYRHLTKPGHKDLLQQIYTAKEWYISPYSGWPNDVKGLSRFICKELDAGRELDREMATLLYFIKDVPCESEQKVVAEQERHVAMGYYDPLVRDNVKYKVRFQGLIESAGFNSDLKLLLELYDLHAFASERGVVRRLMLCERGFRVSEFYFKWDKLRRRFQNVFDGFCYKHDLYGLEWRDGKWIPLLMKVTVNLTPHGLIIYIPKWMSFDLYRDLMIAEIRKLQKARGVLRQGPKISRSRADRKELAKAAYRAGESALRDDITGDDRYDFVIEKCGLRSGTDYRRVRELMAVGKKLVEAERAQVPPDISAKAPAPTVESDRLANARSAIGKLTAEEKELLLKSLAA
jgi:hypothetical protein